jgi:hypothetical protein
MSQMINGYVCSLWLMLWDKLSKMLRIQQLVQFELCKLLGV